MKNNEELQNICTETADQIAQSLVSEDTSIILIMTGKDGWAYSMRGSIHHSKIAIQHVNDDIQSSVESDYASFQVNRA
jgi:hypothetical protein